MILQMENQAVERTRSMFSARELGVLKCLNDLTGKAPGSTIEITEIGFACQIRDSDEVLRALYTLEGKALVEPDPPGDLTSSRWRITPIGMRAVSTMLL